MLKWRKRFYLLGSLALICFLFWVLGFVMGVLAIPFGILAWCVVFVLCLYPLVDFLQDKGVSRGWGTAIAYVVMFAIVALCVWLMVSPAAGIADQFAAITDGSEQYAQSFTEWWQGVSSRYSTLLGNDMVQQAVQQASDSLYQAVGSFSGAFADGVVGFGTFLVNSFITIGFALVISFWVLMDLPGIRREGRRLMAGDHADDAEVIFHTFNHSIGGYIKGTLLQCLIIGVVCGIGYAIIGVPNAAACGVITGILNIIPVVGPWLGGIMAGAIGLMNSPLVAVIAIVIAIIVQQVVYTFISPIIMRDAVDIHPALMIFALMCGSAIGQYMGGLVGNIIGMLLAIPLTAAGKSLFVYFYEKRTGRQIVASDGVFFKAAVREDKRANPEQDAVAPMPQPEMDDHYPYLRHHPARKPTDDQRERDNDRRKRMLKFREDFRKHARDAKEFRHKKDD
ncbi:MAG: AI-2E family transporter [Eggerthellaceae bacterium]